MAKDKIIYVDTSPDKRFIVEGMTKDATTEACIFDLIDNSIDAARDRIVKRKDAKKDRYGLPKDYSGFRIVLKVDEHGVQVEDNCGGIAVQNLAQSAMKPGGQSSHAFGIGYYGVGLKRAIFKLGRSAKIDTDSGRQRVVMELSIEKYLLNKDWAVIAKETGSTGEAKTRIEIVDPTAEVAADFSSVKWQERIKKSLNVRYAKFIEKNLEIEFNKSVAAADEIAMRDEAELSFYRDRLFRTRSGIKYYLSAGIHEDYRFSGEESYAYKVSRDITREFGWYIFCNDRAIVVANRGAETGWVGWHGEYNGFVGTVHFIDEEPAHLPWNTTKTGVDLNNASYQEALQHMRDIATDWRQKAKKYRKPATSSTRSGSKSKAGATGKGGRSGKKPTHHKDLKQLLPLLRTISDSDKIQALLVEASTLIVKDHQYTSVMLLRSLIESILSDYLKRHRKYKDVKEFVFSEITRPLSAEKKKSYRPTLADMIDFVVRNPDVFPDDHQLMCKQAFDKYKNLSSRINNVIHEDRQTVDYAWVVALREAMWPAIDVLLTN